MATVCSTSQDHPSLTISPEQPAIQFDVDHADTEVADKDWVVVAKPLDSDGETQSQSTSDCKHEAVFAGPRVGSAGTVGAITRIGAALKGLLQWRQQQADCNHQRCPRCLENDNIVLEDLINVLKSNESTVSRIEKLQQRLQTNKQLLFHQQEIERQELETSLLPGDVGDYVGRATPSSMESHAVNGAYLASEVSVHGSTDGRTPMEKFFDCEADASIAAERIAELDECALAESCQQVTQKEGLTPSAFDEESYHLRRSALLDDLSRAEEDAKAWKSECIAQGLDPDRARYRRRSSASSQLDSTELEA